MKKHIRKILCCILSLIICLSGVSALASSMQMQWYGDYSDSENPQLVVEFKTPAMYLQRVMVTVYPNSITNPEYTDYTRISEVPTGEGKTETVTFNITNAFSATGGAYKVELNGNGYMQDESSDSTTVYVIRPADIPGLLNEFKNATPSTFADTLDKVIPALQLEAESDETRRAKRIGIMFDIQTGDYNGTFSNLEDIRDAWKVSDVIAYVTDSGATADGLKSKIESNSDLIGINTADSDYTAHIDAVCQSVLTYNGEYNANTGIKCIKDLCGVINQHMGVKAVNAADRDSIYTAFEKYKPYFELDSDALAKYNGFARETRDKVLRSLYQKNFVKNSDLSVAFTSGANSQGTTTDTPVIIVPPVTGGYGSSISGNGAVAPTQTQTPESVRFTDVPLSHWAYSYVTKLADKGVIGGYDDATFKPNNNVTREEFVKMIIEATGLITADAECDFSDVPKNAWYYEYVASGYVNDIIGGIDDITFGVGRNITRQDVAVIAARVLMRLNAQIPDIGESTLTDMASVSDYAQDAVKLLNGMGIISGFDDSSFLPHNALTRAEAAAIISRLTANL